MRKIFLTGLTLAGILFSGCATVQLEPKEVSQNAKQFNQPSDGKSGLYIFRDSVFGAALKKDIWLDDKCLGESAPLTFFYEDVKGGLEHKISTESEFSPNDLILRTESGKNYFVRQYIRPGLFVGGANLEIVDEEEGKNSIAELELAKKGNCSE